MQPADLLFYFNGFNSAIMDDYSGSAKIVAVAEYAQEKAYQFCPVSICYRDASQHARDILGQIDATVKTAVFCGSSMGGWFARILQLMLFRDKPHIHTAAIAFNPAYDLSMHAYLLLGPQTNFVTLEEYEWTADHSDQLRALETGVNYSAGLPYFVYIDKGDELIGWERSAAKHKPISRCISFDGGCHSFDHYREALEDFDTQFTQ